METLYRPGALEPPNFAVRRRSNGRTMSLAATLATGSSEVRS